jgi:deazaflavin-dependent oxidoreductase (nitroreductase family)
MIGRVDTWIYRSTGGRFGGTLRSGGGCGTPGPALLLQHRACNSDRFFVTPLLYITDTSDIVIVAPALGQAETPPWYRNLLAHPDTQVQIGTEMRAVHAVVATADQRARLWPRLVDAFKDFDSYQNWTEREIPVVILQPRRRRVR